MRSVAPGRMLIWAEPEPEPSWLALRRAQYGSTFPVQRKSSGSLGDPSRLSLSFLPAGSICYTQVRPRNMALLGLLHSRQSGTTCDATGVAGRVMLIPPSFVSTVGRKRGEGSPVDEPSKALQRRCRRRLGSSASRSKRSVGMGRPSRTC